MAREAPFRPTGWMRPIAEFWIGAPRRRRHLHRCHGRHRRAPRARRLRPRTHRRRGAVGRNVRRSGDRARAPRRPCRGRRAGEGLCRRRPRFHAARRSGEAVLQDAVSVPDDRRQLGFPCLRPSSRPISSPYVGGVRAVGTRSGRRDGGRRRWRRSRAAGSTARHCRPTAPATSGGRPKALERLAETLAAADLALADAVMLTVTLADIRLLPRFEEVYRSPLPRFGSRARR